MANNLINEQSLNAFPEFFYTIGILPTSYRVSLTYEEQLEEIMKFLRDELIPKFNNNAAALGELQTKFQELVQYVDDYFNNLDLTEEVSNKLNEMATDGTLTELIKNYVNPIFENFSNDINSTITEFTEETTGNINTFKSTVNGQISQINTKVDNLVADKPVVVSSTDDMTDTTKIYINTSDGKWYYYDGTQWSIGGTYQSTGIADKSVNILKLDENLQSNFNVKYSGDISKGTPYTYAYCKKNTSTGLLQIVDNASANYSYYKIELENGKIYQFNGANNLQCCGLIVADSDGNIYYNSNLPVAESLNIATNDFIEIEGTGLYAYISIYTAGSLYINTESAYRLRSIAGIYSNIKINNTITLLETIDGKYLNHSVNNPLQFYSNANASIKVYAMEKGKKYKVSAYDIYSIPGITIADSLYNITYTSWTASQNPALLREYEFTAEYDGFIMLGNYLTYTSTIRLIEENPFNLNKFVNYKIGCDGDSISHGASGQESYVTQIANANNCSLQNLSVGGGTIATETYDAQENPRHWICTSVSNLDLDCDLIMLSGGVNDYWQKVPLGSVSEDYTTAVDSTTFAGALETMCRNVLNRFKTQKIVFVTYHKINNIYYTENASSNGHTFKEYLDLIYEVMNKYSIPVIDINAQGRFNTAIDYYKTNYTNEGDGVHPTTTGYEKFYNQLVINGLNEIL